MYYYCTINTCSSVLFSATIHISHTPIHHTYIFIFYQICFSFYVKLFEVAQTLLYIEMYCYLLWCVCWSQLHIVYHIGCSHFVWVAMVTRENDAGLNSITRNSWPLEDTFGAMEEQRTIVGYYDSIVVWKLPSSVSRQCRWHHWCN